MRCPTQSTSPAAAAPMGATVKLQEHEWGQQQASSVAQAPSTPRNPNQGHGLGWSRLHQEKHQVAAVLRLARVCVSPVLQIVCGLVLQCSGLIPPTCPDLHMSHQSPWTVLRHLHSHPRSLSFFSKPFPQLRL